MAQTGRRPGGSGRGFDRAIFFTLEKHAVTPLNHVVEQSVEDRRGQKRQQQSDIARPPMMTPAVALLKAAPTMGSAKSNFLPMEDSAMAKTTRLFYWMTLFSAQLI